MFARRERTKKECSTVKIVPSYLDVTRKCPSTRKPIKLLTLIFSAACNLWLKKNIKILSQHNKTTDWHRARQKSFVFRLSKPPNSNKKDASRKWKTIKCVLKNTEMEWKWKYFVMKICYVFSVKCLQAKLHLKLNFSFMFILYIFFFFGFLHSI